MRETATNQLGSGSDLKGATNYTKKVVSSGLSSNAQKAEQLNKNTTSGKSQAAERMHDSIQQSIVANQKVDEDPVPEDEDPVQKIESYDLGQTYTAPTLDLSKYEGMINDAYTAYINALNASKESALKSANDAYDENQRKSYAGLRTLMRSLARQKTPFGGSGQWTTGRAYNNYNNTLTSLAKIRDNSISNANTDYASKLASAEADKADRYLKLYSATL